MFFAFAVFAGGVPPWLLELPWLAILNAVGLPSVQLAVLPAEGGYWKRTGVPEKDSLDKVPSWHTWAKHNARALQP